MSLSVMPSGVNFRAGATESSRDILNEQQARQKEQTSPINSSDEVQPKKSHKVRNGILGTLAVAAVVIGGLVAGHKMGGFDKLIKAAEVEDAGKITKGLGTVSKYCESAGKAICEFVKPAVDAVKNIFKKGPEIVEDDVDLIA